MPFGRVGASPTAGNHMKCKILYPLRRLLAAIFRPKRSNQAAPLAMSKQAPNHADYPLPDPRSFPRYIVSFIGGTNALVSKGLYDAYEGVASIHRHIQYCSYPGCNMRLWLDGRILPEYKPSLTERVLAATVGTFESIVWRSTVEKAKDDPLPSA
jgi:hypothetical protein